MSKSHGGEGKTPQDEKETIKIVKTLDDEESFKQFFQDFLKLSEAEGKLPNLGYTIKIDSGHVGHGHAEYNVVHWAAHMGSSDIMKKLLTPAFEAAESAKNAGKMDEYEQIINEYKKQINSQSTALSTPLHMVLKLYLDESNPGKKAEYGYTTLCLLEALVAIDANLNLPNKSGVTPSSLIKKLNSSDYMDSLIISQFKEHLAKKTSAPEEPRSGMRPG